ncbi:hypothetical protein ANCDUO_19243 [Ancylostoma duodenale]|uniref:Transmembrane protein 186 n=1 Tax=Ancylostoma duodenale TaxID=51022 RepID=A0A0C2FQ81_9BILA|nr:hypothetical protein ANCDUO_19243 [Ancylostoma duodenale]
MGLLPVGLLVGRALMDNVARRAGPAQLATSGAKASQRSRSGGDTNYLANVVFNSATMTIELDVGCVYDQYGKFRFRVAVYRYPGIRFAVLLARAKLLQTVASVLYLPYSSYQYAIGHADATFFYSTAALAVLAPVALAVFSRYLNRLIGVIAMNESNDFVRVGYLTFWGARKNKILDIADVLPLTEVSGSKSDSLIKFSWFGGSSFLYLPTRGVEIVDEKRAEMLFGDLSVFNSSKKE